MERCVRTRGLWVGTAPYQPWRRFRSGSEESMLIVGPTRSGKTRGIVIPAILEWNGPLLVLSVKDDVRRVTEPWRALCGPVVTVAPGDGGDTVDVLAGCDDVTVALRVARELVITGRGDSEFWNALATKALATFFCDAARRGLSVDDVMVAIAQRQLPRSDDALLDDVATSLLAMEPRTFDAVMTTVDAMVAPWAFNRRAVDVQPTLHQGGTVYLCAPLTDQATYEPLFRLAVRRALEIARRDAPLLVVLDEAAQLAPLQDLDQVAATASGQHITLMTVFQDFSQIQARYGDRAATVVNNHRCRVVLAGLSDPATDRFVPEVTAACEALRMAPPGRAWMMRGHEAVRAVSVHPWSWRGGLRARGVRR